MNQKKITVARKVKVVAVVGVVTVAYVWHRRKLDAAITAMTDLSQSSVQETMWSSFDEGVRYGMRLVSGPAETVADALDRAA